MKTLVVEDTYTSRLMLKEFMVHFGDVDEAEDGVKGLRLFKLSWQKDAAYDLVFLDIMMPQMSGLTLLKEIRNFEKQQGIEWQNGVKIIMTTALNDATSVKQAITLHCNDYMVKPIKKDQLIKKLDKLGFKPDDVVTRTVSLQSNEKPTPPSSQNTNNSEN